MKARTFAGALVVVLLCVFILADPGVAVAGDFTINVSDPDRQGHQDYQGSTVNTVLSVPTIGFGDNQTVGTLRITGKSELASPLAVGNKIMITLPAGSCYMQTPNPSNYRHYVEWPTAVDGKKNQICDNAGQPGILFVSGNRHSLVVAVNNVDPTGTITVIDIVFHEKDYSTIRVSALCDRAPDYSNDPGGTISRAEFFQGLTEVILPFASSPVKWENSGHTRVVFSDVPVQSSVAGNIGILAGAGVIKGYPDGTLKPQEHITRIEAGNLLGNLFPPQENVIERSDVPAWATALQTTFAKGIMTGYPDGTFKPDQCLTKAEALIVLQNTLEAF